MRFKHCPHCQALNEIPQSLLKAQEGAMTQMNCIVPGGCNKSFFAVRDKNEAHGVGFFEEEPVTKRVDNSGRLVQQKLVAVQATA